MAIENKPGEEFDTVFSRNDSLELSSHHERDPTHARIFKIIVIGDSNVGKTCLTYRFCGGTFLKNPEATIGVDFRERTLELDGESIKLQIWDTAGQERFRKSMVEHYYRSVHAVIFVYDVTSLSSFRSVPEWIEECSRHCVGPLVPRIMVGNKCDLRDRREVPTSAAQCLADSYDFPLFETSAKDPAEKEHVDAIFLTLAYRLKSHKPLRLKQPSQTDVRHLWNQKEQESASLKLPKVYSYDFPLFETSAKDPAEKEHVDAIFLTLAYRLKSHKPLRLKQPSQTDVRHLWNQKEQESASCQC